MTTPAWDVPQVSEGERGPSCRRRRYRRCSVRVLKKSFRLGTSASPRCSKLLAAVMGRWPSPSRSRSRKVAKNHPHVVPFILILLKTYTRPSEFLTLKNDFPTACTFSLMVVGRDRSFRNGSVQNPRWLSLGESALTLMSQQVADHVRNTSLLDSASIGYTVSELCQTCEALCGVSQDTTRTLLPTLRSNLETIERHVEKLMTMLSRTVSVGSTVSPTLLLSAEPSRNAHFRWSTALNRDHNSTRRPPEREENNEICDKRWKIAQFGPLTLWVPALSALLGLRPVLEDFE